MFQKKYFFFSIYIGLIEYYDRIYIITYIHIALCIIYYSIISSLHFFHNTRHHYYQKITTNINITKAHTIQHKPTPTTRHHPHTFRTATAINLQPPTIQIITATIFTHLESEIALKTVKPPLVRRNEQKARH